MVAVVGTVCRPTTRTSWKVLPGAKFISNPGLGCPARSAADCWHSTRVAGIVAADRQRTEDNQPGSGSQDPAGAGHGHRQQGPPPPSHRGIIWAADPQGTVINLSCAATSDDATMHAAVRYAVGKGIPVVAAAGNLRERQQDRYPGSLPANHGEWRRQRPRPARSLPTPAQGHVDVAAPGGSANAPPERTSVNSPWRRLPRTRRNVHGNSVCQRHHGPAACDRAHRDPDQLQQLNKQRTATDLGVKGRDNDFGAGLIDPVAALQQISVLPGELSGVDGHGLGDVLPRPRTGEGLLGRTEGHGWLPGWSVLVQLSAPNSTVGFWTLGGYRGPSRTLTGLVVGARYRLADQAENRVGASWPVSMGFRQATPPSAVAPDGGPALLRSARQRWMV